MPTRQKFSFKKVLVGGLVSVALLSGVSMFADSTTDSSNIKGAVAQIDVAAFNGGEIAKEASLGRNVKKGQTVLELNKTQYVAQMNIDKAKLAKFLIILGPELVMAMKY